MQGDDNFDYEEDNDSAPSPQIKASSSTGETINKTLTVTGIRGEDVVLKCDVGWEQFKSLKISLAQKN